VTVNLLIERSEMSVYYIIIIIIIIINSIAALPDKNNRKNHIAG